MTTPRSTNAPEVWLVGATWGADDQTARFLTEGIWQNGYADRYLDKVRQIAPGDAIAIKATTTQRRGLPFDAGDRDVSKLIIKAQGVVLENLGDGRTVRVDWRRRDVRAWYFYTYRGTIWRLRRGARLRAFVLEDTPQDYDAFLGQRAAPQLSPEALDALRVLTRLPISRG